MLLIKINIPAVRLTCIACFSPISQSIFINFDEILQGLFLSHAATTVKFLSENIV